MKLAISLAAAGLALASAIADNEEIKVFQDIHADPRWTNTTVVSPLSLTSHYRHHGHTAISLELSQDC